MGSLGCLDSCRVGTMGMVCSCLGAKPEEGAPAQGGGGKQAAPGAGGAEAAATGAAPPGAARPSDRGQRELQEAYEMAISEGFVIKATQS